MRRQSLGTLTKLNLQEAWESEAGHFTPWLAEEDNLNLLGETIQLELELLAQEKSVGAFRADIVCLDAANRSKVLIENQLARTDHSHLGQLMTYAAGLEAVTIVWIAERFTEEHRAALDWLNRLTDDRVNFFGLEIELWKIGDSTPAPKFNTVVKPSEWTRPGPDLTETQQLYLEYWTALRDRLKTANSPIRMGKPMPQMWMTFKVGRSGFCLSASTSRQNKATHVQLIIYEPNRFAHYELLRGQKEEIEKELGTELTWRELPNGKESHVRQSFENTDPADKADWPRQHETVQRTLEAFHTVFAPRVKLLDAADWQGEGEDTE